MALILNHKLIMKMSKISKTVDYITGFIFVTPSFNYFIHLKFLYLSSVIQYFYKPPFYCSLFHVSILNLQLINSQLVT